MMNAMNKGLSILVMLLAMLFSGSLLAEGTVSGVVLEQDATSPIPNAMVRFSGVSFAGDSLEYQFFTDTLGNFVGQLEAGEYHASASAPGYDDAALPNTVMVNEGATVSALCFILHEHEAPVGFVLARNFGNHFVKVDWDMDGTSLSEDFETGDFSSFRWDNTVSDFPWEVTAADAYSGTYSMKSTCEGVASGVSEIEIIVKLATDSRLSFFQRISSEDTWDCGKFYLDNEVMSECSGDGAWEEVAFDIPEGVHLLRWSYSKDADNDLHEDCYFIDDIRLVEVSAAPRSLRCFHLYRRRFDETPVLLASNLTEWSFMDMGWSSLPWGAYSYGVSCVYEGNRGETDIVWSNALGKDLTTSVEVVAATNTGLTAQGAVVTLTPSDSLGTVYSDVLDEQGRCAFDAVTRGAYWLSVQLAGYEDYVSDSLVPIFEPTTLQVNLLERIFDLKALYVSPTGWAMLSLADSLQNYVQYYELMLDSLPLGDVHEVSFQMEVAGLTAGQSYQCQARPVFLSGAGNWSSYDWSYRPCDAFPGLENLQLTEVGNDALQLDWSMPEADSLLGYAVFRNGTLLAMASECQFVDAAPEFFNDHVDYCVRAVYDSTATCGYFAMSCASCIGYDMPDICDPTVNLEGSNYFNDETDYGALISWGVRPEPINQWLFYDNDTLVTTLGADGRLYWGIKFEADEVAEYLGTSLSKLALFDVAAGAYQIWIYFGDAISPGTLVHYQTMHLEGRHCWHTETLSADLPLRDDTPVWVVISQLSVAFPAAACRDMGHPNGRWVSTDGVNWNDLSYYNLNYTWMLRAFVTNQHRDWLLGGDAKAALVQYNVYRAYDGVNYSLVASVPHVAGVDFYQYRDVLVDETHSLFYYQVRAYYDTGCESEPAFAMDFPSQNYVIVDDAWDVKEHEPGCAVYPNPTDGKVWVCGDALARVSVLDAMGRVVLVTEGADGAVALDLSSLPDGLYLLHVASLRGLETHRVLLCR